MAESLLRVIRTENYVKFGHAVFEIFEWKDTSTDIQTDRHADRNIRPPSGGEVNSTGRTVL